MSDDKNYKAQLINKQDALSHQNMVVTEHIEDTFNTFEPVYIQAHECRKKNKFYNKATKAWEKSLVEYFPRLSQEYGYENLINSFIAMSGISEAHELIHNLKIKSRKDSLEITNNYRLEEYLRNELGDRAFKGREVDWANIPIDTLKNIPSFDMEHIINMLYSGNYELPFDAIFPKVIDISRDRIGIIAIDLHPENILEKLVLDNKPHLIALYLYHGGEIKNKLIGANALEKLILNTPTENIQNYSDVISILSGKGMKVRYRIDNKGQLKIGRLIEHFYRASERTFYQLESFGFKLEITETEESIRTSPEYFNLKDMLVENRNSFVNKNYNIDSSDYIAKCEYILKFVDDLVLNPESIEKVNMIINEYADDEFSLIKKLFDIEPGISDCIVKKDISQHTNESIEEQVAPRYSEITDIINTYFELGIHYAISKILLFAPTDEEKKLLFNRVAANEPNDIVFLKESNLLPSVFSTHELMQLDSKILTVLVELGYNLDISSDTNRSLVEMAASACKPDQVSWLAKNNYTYQFGDTVSDALAIGIRTPCYNDHKRKLNLISAIMEFNPPFKKYHKQRLAELRLMNYELYNDIVGRFPHLEISIDEQPSGYFCNTVRYSKSAYSYF